MVVGWENYEKLIDKELCQSGSQCTKIVRQRTGLEQTSIFDNEISS